MPWNPDQYLRFSDHRLRPALELLARIPIDSPRCAYDLGSGTGEVTRLIADRWPSADVHGIDSSCEMLEKARGTPSRVQWTQAAIEDWRPDGAPDLIYSNATLHWVEGHSSLFPRLIEYLSSGGCLAAQMPLSWGAASHRLMRETLADTGVGSEALRETVGRKWVEDAEVYYELLADRVEMLDIWHTEYLQELDGDDPVLEWVRGTGLRPVLDGLDDRDRGLFLTEYKRRLRDAYPARANGRTLYPFRRLFLVARV